MPAGISTDVPSCGDQLHRMSGRVQPRPRRWMCLCWGTVKTGIGKLTRRGRSFRLLDCSQIATTLSHDENSP
jgi:hypothetical protein